MIILMAILDFGRVVYAYSVVANAAREGVRAGIVDPDDGDHMAAVTLASAIALDPDRLTVVVSYPTDDTVRVQATYLFDLVTPLMSIVLGRNTVPLRSTATMYVGY